MIREHLVSVTCHSAASTGGWPIKRDGCLLSGKFRLQKKSQLTVLRLVYNSSNDAVWDLGIFIQQCGEYQCYGSYFKEIIRWNIWAMCSPPLPPGPLVDTIDVKYINFVKYIIFYLLWINWRYIWYIRFLNHCFCCVLLFPREFNAYCKGHMVKLTQPWLTHVTLTM